MSTELAFTAAWGGATMGLTLSTPAGWVAVGIAGAVGLFGALIAGVVEIGKTQRAKNNREKRS